MCVCVCVIEGMMDLIKNKKGQITKTRLWKAGDI